MADKSIAEALQRFDDAETAWAQVREDGLADAKFALEGVQWPDDIQEQRRREGRPCLTINRLPPMIRQVAKDRKSVV